jgi:hypothetical protein
MNPRAILILFLTLAACSAACSSSGKSGAGGSGGTFSSGDGGEGGSFSIAGSSGTDASGDACAVDASASGCFSHGTWQIDNVSPCFFSLSGDAGATEGAISTVQSGQLIECPADLTAAPTETWSTNTLTTDCTGHYTLCYTLKAGSAASPQPTDCIVIHVCTEGDYVAANEPQPWPDLPGWISTGAENACAKTFNDSGGYGVKSVTGTPTGCASISKTLGTVTYCPLSCNQPNPPSLCATCVFGATDDGGF